ncbi:dityrosine transporter 1 [Monosporozyma servazzii]
MSINEPETKLEPTGKPDFSTPEEQYLPYSVNTQYFKESCDEEDLTQDKIDEDVETEKESTGEVKILPYSCFTKNQKYVIFLIIMFIGFLGPMSGNIYIPALPLLQKEFKTTTSVINATVSVFMGVFAVGPLFWGMFADFGGRKILYLISLLLMIIVNVLLAALPSNIVSLFILRVVQAFASSSVIALGAGTVTDIISPADRGKAIAYFMMGPNIGPVLAPIIAGLILIDDNNWRWLFGFTCIMGGVGFLLVLVFLPETLRCIRGNGDPGWKQEALNKDEEQILTEYRKAKWTFCKDIGIQKPVSTSTIFKEKYPKPPRATIKTYWEMVKIKPVFFTSVSTALLFANYYAFSVTFSHYLESEYHYSPLKIGAAYVCPGVCMILGSQIGGHLSDALRKYWKKKHPNRVFPLEERLILNIVGIIINTVGCIGYGWSIQKKYHIALVLFFTGLTAAGLTWCNNTTMTYLTELLSKRAASSVAVSSLFRNVAAAISSAIIFKLCNVMGVGWCFTGLGLVNVIPLALISWLVNRSGRWQNYTSYI